MVNRFARHPPPHVRVYLVGEEDTACGLLAVDGCSDTRRIGKLRRSGILGELFPDMRHPGHIVRLGSQGRGAAENIGNTRLAPAVAVTMGISKEESESSPVLPLAAHEDSFPGDKDIVEDDHRIRDAISAEGGGV